MAGTLYIVATPIGNLADITQRSVDILGSSDVVACEDTRQTQKLMHHLGLKKPLVHYDEHNHVKVATRLIQELKMGKNLALVTDAGTPAISDPGSRLVKMVVSEDIKVVPIPGPSSVTAALSVSGFSADSYVFLGFLPKRPGRAKRLLQEAFGLGRTIVVFESPYRVETTLKWVAENCPQAQLLLAREMTKMFEEFIRGDVEDVTSRIQKTPKKGEFVIVIGQEKNK